MNKLDSIVNILSELNFKELQIVNSLVIELLSIYEKSKYTNTHEFIFYDAITLELNKSRITPPAFEIFMSASNMHRKYSESIEELDNYISRLWGLRKRGEISSIYKIFVSIIVQDIKQNEWPLSMKMVINNILRVPELVNLQFPGYVESGLAHIILERLNIDMGSKNG